MFVFWVFMCELLRRFEGMYCSHHQGDKSLQADTEMTEQQTNQQTKQLSKGWVTLEHFSGCN